MEKIAPRGQEDFFLLIQTLPTFWATRIWILRIFLFGFVGSQNVQISRFQISRNLEWAGIGPWAGLGPSAGPGWALGWAGGVLGWAGGI